MLRLIANAEPLTKTDISLSQYMAMLMWPLQPDEVDDCRHRWGVYWRRNVI